MDTGTTTYRCGNAEDPARAKDRESKSAIFTLIEINKQLSLAVQEQSLSFAVPGVQLAAMDKNNAMPYGFTSCHCSA